MASMASVAKIGPENRPRLVTTVHGYYSVNFYSRIMTRGEAVICISNSIKEYVLNNYPNTSEDKLSIIHRGVDTNQYHADFYPTTTWQETWYRDFPETKSANFSHFPGE